MAQTRPYTDRSRRWAVISSGWRSAYAALAVTSAVWAALWWRVGHDGPHDVTRAGRDGTGTTAAPDGRDGAATAATATAPDGRLPYRRLLSTGTVLGSIAAAFGAQWALSLSHAWLPAYLRTQLGLSAGAAASAISALSAVSLVLLLTVPSLMDVLRRRGVSSRWSSGAGQAAAVCLAGGAMAAFPFVDGTVARLALMTVAFGGASVAIPLHYMTTAEVAPPAQRGALFGIVAATGTLPGLLAPFLTAASSTPPTTRPAATPRPSCCRPPSCSSPAAAPCSRSGRSGTRRGWAWPGRTEIGRRPVHASGACVS
ncbi:MFS transporter [Streptomyces sp. NPDC014776]|uniref:MFS transporter n=1 Tax=Streptomyces sp. NPDC014776 TaxID=3364909 RepID=UPI0036F5EE25